MGIDIAVKQKVSVPHMLELLADKKGGKAPSAKGWQDLQHADGPFIVG